MTVVVKTKGGAVLGLLASIGRAVATGMSAAKDVDEGCDSCPDDPPPRRRRQRPRPRIRPHRRRR